MLKVAITGNIASGKTTVENILKEKYPVLDTDEVAHELLMDEEIQTQLKSTFADFDILDDNQISRLKLGQIVFADEHLRKKLESILHPPIKNRIKEFFKTQAEMGQSIAFASVPLLFEAKFEDEFEKIILVYADDNLRLERLMNRNNLSLEYAENRLKIQISQDEKTSMADYVIYNNADLKALSAEIEKFLSYLLKNSTLPESK